jgi:uncharacterized protein (DUF433 family)
MEKSRKVKRPTRRSLKEKRPSYKMKLSAKTRAKFPNGRWTTTRATDKIIETDHPYIHKVPGVVGGEPVIKGTRISVRDVVEWWRLGWSLDEMLENFPHLRLAQICDALGYFDDHREEVLEYIKENHIFASEAT